MSRSRWISRTAVLSATVFFNGALHLSAAEWYRDYERGLEALKGRRYQDAIALLESARSSGPAPGDRVRYFGMRFDPFYPYVYLGQAYQGAGQCEKALEMFQVSEQTEPLANARDLIPLREAAITKGCDRPLVTTTVAPLAFDCSGEISQVEIRLQDGKTRDVERALSDLSGRIPGGASGERCRLQVNQIRLRVQSIISSARQSLSQGADLLDRRQYDRARRELRKALEVDVTAAEAEDLLEKLDVAAASEEIVNTALTDARRALRQGDFEKADAELDRARRRDPDNARVRSLKTDLEVARQAESNYRQQRYPESERLLSQLLGRDSRNDWARRRLREVRAALGLPEDGGGPDLDPLRPIWDLVESGQVGRAWEELAALPSQTDRQDLTELRAAIDQAARGKARRAARRILNGEREEAIPELLDVRPALSDRAAVHLYLAWAYYGSYLKGGAEDPSLHAKASDALREALRIDAQLEADERFFSPRFGALLDEVRNEQRP